MASVKRCYTINHRRSCYHSLSVRVSDFEILYLEESQETASAYCYHAPDQPRLVISLYLLERFAARVLCQVSIEQYLQ